MSNNTENRTPHQTMIELCNRVQELALELDGLQSRMQTEQVARVKAERVLSLIAHSTIGDYDWCREVCNEYLGRSEVPNIPELSAEERVGRRPLDLKSMLEASNETLEPVSKPILRAPSRRKEDKAFVCNNDTCPPGDHQLQIRLKELEAERDLWKTRTASLVAHLPPQMVAGEPQAWANEYTQEVERLRAALEKIANRDEACEGDCNPLHEIAREALKDYMV